MALIDNVVHEQSTTTGSGNMTIGALNGRQRFSSAFSTGGSDTFYYSILNQDAGEWEIGTGSLADANTLVRDTVLASSNSGLAVTFSAGTKDVVNGIPQSDAALLSDLASTSNGFGASLIGVEDSGGLITATTVEGALAEIASDLAALVTGATGSGALVFGTSPTLAGPTLTGTVALSSGGVLSWNSGDVTATHSANTLTFAGATGNYIFNDGYIVVDRIGLGTTPSTNMHLASSAPAILLEDTTDTSYVRIRYDFSACLFEVDTANTATGSNFRWLIDNSEVGRWTTTGLGIGTTGPAAGLDILQDSGGVRVTSIAPGLTFRRAGTSVSSPTAVSGGQNLGSLPNYGYDGTTYTISSNILFQVDGAVSSGIVPGRILFYTANTSGTNTERMRIDSSGNVGIGATPSADTRLYSFASTGTTPIYAEGLGPLTQGYRNVIFAKASNSAAAMGIGLENAGTAAVNTSTYYNSYANRTTGGQTLMGQMYFSMQSIGNTTYASDWAVKTAVSGSLDTRLYIDSSGNVGIGTTSQTEMLDVNSDAIRIRTSQTPASAAAAGTAGMICWDSSYIYVCTATNTWKRAAIATW